MNSEAGATRLERSYFEELYDRDPDPWRFASSEYERDKYSHTLEALGGRRFDRALEVGCSIGVFTEQLAWRCRDLLALDVSEQAVVAAAQRVRRRPWVRVQRRSLPEDTPAGPFDLIVCSEVLYYWSEPLLAEGLDVLSAALRPGGLLLAVHFTDRTHTYPLQGHRVHELVRSHPCLTPVHGEDRSHYRLDLLERA